MWAEDKKEHVSDFELPTLIAQFRKGEVLWEVTAEAKVYSQAGSRSGCVGP